MNEAFPEAIVIGYELLIPTLANNEDDRHVLAAAIRANAQYIVTQNVRHFPAVTVEPFGIRAVSADTFLLDLCEDEMTREALSSTIIRQSQSLRRPQLTARQVLRALTSDIPETCRMLEGHLERTQPHMLDRSWAFATGVETSDPAAEREA